jgi:hypothetical protein
MGPHKSDKDFRIKMNQRQITPSANAWDRLDTMLTIAEEKKIKNKYGWLYIAATIAGFLLIGTIFFSQTEKLIDKGRDEVVIQNRQKPQNERPVTEELLQTDAQNQSMAEASEPKIKVKSSNKNNRNPHERQRTGVAIINQNQSIERQENDESSNPTNAVNQINKNQSLIAAITQAKGEQAGGNQKTEQQTASAKVDELLAAVTTQNSGTNKSTLKVNAKNLLSEVDKDVNLSFREKLMRTAHRSYQEVAEAVSTRNIQQ